MMMTASKHFTICSDFMVLAMFILNYGIVLQSESTHAVKRLVEIQDPMSKEIYFSYNKSKTYNMSNHVFYRLYTREQPDGRLLNRSDPSMIKSTNFSAENPIKLIVHGWLGSFYEKELFCSYIMKAYLRAGKFNVICVDWMQLTFDLDYASAKINVKRIGSDIATVLTTITTEANVGSENVHLIGHGMGAHIVGHAGKELSGKIPRITGLDPALPLYETSDPKYRINQTDAVFVDIIHTNGNGLGIFKPLGHIDFYPNGGQNQPNCSRSDKVTGGACSHNKAFIYFAQSMLTGEELKALQCSGWNQYKAVECGDFANSTYMGEHVDKKTLKMQYRRLQRIISPTHVNTLYITLRRGVIICVHFILIICYLF